MIKIKLQQGRGRSPRLVPPIDMNKVEETGHNLNIIVSIGYMAMVNSATYFIVDYLAQIKRSPLCKGKLKSYINRIREGMRKFERTFKYEFPNLKAWQDNLDLTDYIYEKMKPTCKGIYFAISNELGKTVEKTEDRDMLSNMIVGAILLYQATTLFDEIFEKARKETGYNFRPHFEMLSAKCIEYPFGEAFMIVSETYGIDAESLTKMDPVCIGIDTIVNIMGDENTYREAKESVENDSH